MTAVLLGVQPNAVNQVWSDIRPWIIHLIEEDDSIDELGVVENLMNGQLQLWIVKDVSRGIIQSVLITKVEIRLKRQVCTIHFLGGKDMDSWIHLLPDLESWAKHIGCGAIDLVGRPGWSRRLKEVGFTLTDVVMEKRLEH